MLSGLLITLDIFVCIALVIVVLLQRSEGGAFGMGGGPTGLVTARGAGDLLTRTTWILFGTFIALSLSLSLLGAHERATSSVLEKLKLQQVNPNTLTTQPLSPPPPAPGAPPTEAPAPSAGLMNPPPIAAPETAPPAAAAPGIAAPGVAQPTAPARAHARHKAETPGTLEAAPTEAPAAPPLVAPAPKSDETPSPKSAPAPAPDSGSSTPTAPSSSPPAGQP